MKNYQLSDDYKELYREIIGDLLSQVCNAEINYCVRDNKMIYELGSKFDEYTSKALKNMAGTKLDRHKLSSCICGAIIEKRPLVGFNGAQILKKANEIFALHVGVNVLKYYMMHDLLEHLNIPLKDRYPVVEHLKKNFVMQFPGPEENVCDTQEYRLNLYNALYWTHGKCDITKQECFRYDIWAYSKIFYHLELYNKEYLKMAYNEYAVNT